MGINLAGRRCGPNPEGQWYENVHVGSSKRGQPMELVRGDAESVNWRVEAAVGRLDTGDFDFGDPFVHGKRGERLNRRSSTRWLHLMDSLLDYDFHPPDDLRLFQYETPSVLRFDETVLVVEVDYCGTLLRHYAFPDRWFKINCTTNLSGNFVEEQRDPALIPFCFNCDIATPMLRQSNAVFGVNLWIDVLIRSNGASYQVIDEDDFAYATQQGWLSEREAHGARSGLDELLDMIDRKELIAFLSDLHPFRPTTAPAAIDMRRVPQANFPIVHPGLRPTW